MACSVHSLRVLERTGVLGITVQDPTREMQKADVALVRKWLKVGSNRTESNRERDHPVLSTGWFGNLPEVASLTPTRFISLLVQKPEMASLQKLVTPMGEALGEANKLTEGKRKPSFNHAKALAESLSCLTWVLYTEKGCGERCHTCGKILLFVCEFFSVDHVGALHREGLR